MTLDTSWACHQGVSNRDNVELFGTEGGASVRPARLYRGSAGLPATYEIVDELKIALKMPHEDRFHNFINHLLGQEELCVTSQQALVVQKILDAIAEVEPDRGAKSGWRNILFISNPHPSRKQIHS